MMAWQRGPSLTQNGVSLLKDYWFWMRNRLCTTFIKTKKLAREWSAFLSQIHNAVWFHPTSSLAFHHERARASRSSFPSDHSLPKHHLLYRLAGFGRNNMRIGDWWVQGPRIKNKMYYFKFDLGYPKQIWDTVSFQWATTLIPQ